MGVARWILMTYLAAMVLGQVPGTDRPDITMLYKDDTQICVAGNNTNNFGLTLMSEDMLQNIYIKFKYKDKYDISIDSTKDCDFEETEGNDCRKQWRSNDIKLRSAWFDPISPVMDARWNNFEIYRTNGRKGRLPKYDKKYEILQENFYIGISVRSKHDSQILLCETDNPKEGKCYWIIIDGITKMFDMTSIRKCVKGIPDKWASDKDPECKEIKQNITKPQQLLSETKWTHFLLSREDRHSIQLSLWDLNTGTTQPLLNYKDGDPFRISFMYVRSYNEIADWKIHKYQYLMLKKKDIILLGPQLNFAVNASICVSLYVVLCPECQMELRLEKEDGDIKMKSVIKGDRSGSYMTWKNVRLEGEYSASHGLNYYLYASLSTIDGNEPPNSFWGIDDFRTCSINEFQVASKSTPTKLLCQSLKYPSWTFNNDKQVLDYDKIEPPICPDGTYIGQHCDISCFSILKNGCGGHQICSAIEDSNKGACVCAAGRTWDYYGRCTNKCYYGYYGYNCKEKCGKCKDNNCYEDNGYCKYGCDEGYLPPKCKTTYPRLKYAPTVIFVSPTTVTVRLDDTSIDGPNDTKQSVILECMKANYNRGWFVCSDQLNLSPGMEVSTKNLEKETTYLIRALIYINQDAYRNNDLPTVQVNTTCEVYRNIYITEYARNASVTFEELADSCLIAHYVIELRQNGVKIKDAQQAWQNMFFLNLKPYLEYEIIITHERYTSYTENKDFKTKEDAPGEIKDLKILNTTETEVILAWEEPEEKNGVIRKYTVTYQLHQRINCTDSPDTHYGNLIVNPSKEEKEFRPTLSGLQPYSVYSITITAETNLPGKPKFIQAHTEIASVIGEKELPESFTISDGDFSGRSVNINWELKCLKQQGPLLFKIVLTCVQDEWCNQTQDINLMDINVKNRGITTHDITPFTHYKIEFSVKRLQDDDYIAFNRTREYFSPLSSPPAVQSCAVYSRNKESISIRWLDPYPPHGHLDNYKINYCYFYNYYNYCSDLEITRKDLTSCDLWDTSFNCYVLTNLYTNYQYTITITAKNKKNQFRGDETQLKAYTQEGTSSAPLNLTRHWEDNELNLFWKHPNITNGKLKKFIIVLKQNGTELTNQDEKPFYNYVLEISEEMKNYTFAIQKSFRYSSSYVLTICGVNEYFGENATLHIDTPPETPELTEDVIIDAEQITNATVMLAIPGAKKNTKSKNSFLYVVVSKIGSRMSKRQAEQQNNLEEEILKYSSSPNSWIAIERELNEENSVVIIGDETSVFSDKLKKNIYNKNLEPLSTYDVTVVLINLYREQKSTKPYQYRAQTIATIVPPSPGLFALLLLLLVPVVGYFGYRYISKKNIRGTSMMMIPGLRNVRTDDQHDPDVIPLTEASSEPVQSKQKKPAIAPKPGSSSKHSTETVAPPPEVNATATNLFHSRIVLLENLENYLKEALQNGDLDEQHALFPRGQTKPWDYGMLKPNKFKNRYNNLIACTENIIPYHHAFYPLLGVALCFEADIDDKNRVRLEKINNDENSDYINASYIHGYRQDKAYIATQGPKLATVNDFWRMVWQEKVQYIVMLANVVEAGKKKCEKYWPEIDSSKQYGHVDVHFKKSEVFADYEYRTFELTCKEEKRKVTQLHFTSWPDHGVPLYPQSLVPFLKKMLTIRQNTPVIVHCSAGVGRTGTIILSDICLRMAAREKAVDVLRYLHEIREQRANMVDNIDQYKLVHMVLLECLLAPDTTIPCNAVLSNAIQKLTEEGGLQIQLNYLQQSSWQDIALNFASPKEQNTANVSKNRFQEIVPCENQIYISRYPVDDDNADYINAVPVDGFRFKEQFIVTQTPMPNTVKDFWRMIAEKSVKIIVTLNDIPLNDQTSCIFWPSEDEEMKPVPNINLKYHKIQSYDCYDIHSIILDNKSSQEATLIKIVQFKNWKHGNKLPEDKENLVMLWEETENLSHGNYPMVVSCYDGATASGFFVAMSFVIEKIKLEQQCDPCLAVRVIRRNRKQFVSNKVQFEFLYRSAVIYLSMFETYSNFQPVVKKPN